MSIPTSFTEMSIETAAITAHNVNKAYCKGLGDYSQPEWNDAPDEHRESLMAGVRAIARTPAITPAIGHANWIRRKELDGWRYGPEKDLAKKEHPCMVDYLDLGVHQRHKDSLFSAAVRGVLGIP